MNGPFALDKANGKLLGVCSGFARWADIDLLLVRIGCVALGLYLFPLMILFYIAIGRLAPEAVDEVV